MEDQVHLTTADGDYDILTTDSLGSLHVNAEAHHVFDTFNATTGWTVLGDDTANLATTTKHVTGTNALTFDKVNGAGNTTVAGIQKTLTSVDLGAVSQHDLLQGTFYIPDLTDISYIFLRLGTDSTNYNEWRLPDTALTAATFETGALALGDASYDGITGNGWDPSAITYIALGAVFDNQTDTLAGLVFDEISYHTNQHTAAILGAEVTSEVSTPNINLQKIGGSVTDKGSGNASNGSQRVVIATDDVNLAAINAGQLADGHNVSTELPTASALADNTANPTVPGVGSFGMLWDGATWDRWMGNTSQGGRVDLRAFNGTAVSVNEGAADSGTLRSVEASRNIKTVSGTENTSGETSIVAAVASNKIRVVSYMLTTKSSTEVLATWLDGSAGTELKRTRCVSPNGDASFGESVACAPPGALFTTSVNTALILNLSGAVAVDYSISYYEEA
jgi:hypothetical protein